MTFKKHRISKLYMQIIACYLCLILFSGAVLVSASLIYAKQNEDNYLTKLNDGILSANRRMTDNLLSLFDLCSSIISNKLITENLKPSDLMTVENLYYYPSILDYLRQSRLQFDSIADSIFLYTDDKRVIYSINERGMTDLKTYFSRFMAYQTYDEAFWRTRLTEPDSFFTILPADRYTTPRVHDERLVIPLVFRDCSLGYPMVLVMNLSLDKIIHIYADSQLFSKTAFFLYDQQGKLINDTAGAPDFTLIQAAARAQWDGEYCYVVKERLGTLGFTVVALTPISAFSSLSAYFRFMMFGLAAVYLLCALILALLLSKRAYAPIREVKRDLISYANVKQDPAAYVTNELEAIKTDIRLLAAERENFKIRNRLHSMHYVSQTYAMLLDGRTVHDEMYFLSLLESEYGFKKRSFCCTIFLIDTDEKAGYPIKSELLNTLTDCLISSLEGSYSFIQTYYQDNMLTLLFDANAQELPALRALLQHAQERFEQGSVVSLRLGMGSAVYRLDEIGESFERACSDVFALTQSPIAPSRQSGFHYDRNEVIAAARSRDLKAICDLCEDILSQAKLSRLTYSEVADIARDIYKTVLETEQRFSPEMPRGDERALPVIDILLLSPEINITPFISALIRFMPYRNSHPEKAAEDIAHRLQAYIDIHYSEELSLDILSDKVGVSPKYLSRVFKQAMGVNLTDYLAAVRIARVKELLKTDMPLDKVSENVGIFNRTTFTRTFRKLEGMTPAEFRAAERRRG